MNLLSIKLAEIHCNTETQSRVTIDHAVVDDYAERMLEGDKFPPVVLFKDSRTGGSSRYFLADGFHRVAACIKNDFKDIEADVREGCQMDAISFAIGANVTNGLRRSNRDKHRCIRMALETFGAMSNRAIADKVKVSDLTVAKVRADFDMEKSEGVHIYAPSDECQSAPAGRIGLDGKTYAARQEKAKSSATTKCGDSQILAALKNLWRKAVEVEKNTFIEWHKLQEV